MASPALEYTPELVAAETRAATDERLNIQLLQRNVLNLWSRDKTTAIELGHALVAVREAMFQQGHGNFARWCRENKIPKNRVNYCIRQAEGKKNPTRKDNPPKDTHNVAVPFSQSELKWLANTAAMTRGLPPGEFIREIVLEWLQQESERVTREIERMSY